MLIERTSKEVIVRLPSSIEVEDLQDFLDYSRYKQITSKFSVTQKVVDKLVIRINKKWQKKT